MRRVLAVVAFVLGASACHTSCTEETGAEPVVVVEAGSGTLVGQQRPPNVRPMMHPVTPLHAIPAATANGEN